MSALHHPGPIALISPSSAAKENEPPQFRVLALCGYTQNAYIMKKKTSALRKACKEAEFVYLQPPHILSKIDFSTGTFTLADLNSSEANLDENDRTVEEEPRAWFISEKVYGADGNENGVKYVKINETIQYVYDFLAEQKQPFDGIFGFSQGGCMASLVAALLERPGLHPSWTPNPALKPLQYAIFSGGLLAQDPALKHFYPLQLPTLHIIGKNDVIVSEARSKALVSECEDNRVEYHDGGHFVPSKANWRHFLRSYICSFTADGEQGDLPPPGATAPPSGATTPTSSTHTPLDLSRLAISNDHQANEVASSKTDLSSSVTSSL